jgi:hypothetical protein
MITSTNDCKYFYEAATNVSQIIQYYTHHFMLHAQSPNFISNLHKSYFHSITTPYSLTTNYDHPLPYLILRFLPIYAPAIILRMHLLTYLLLLSLTTLEETLSLSGYSAIPGIMLGGIARRQDLHSESKGKGNFAPWGFLDWVHGTSLGADVMDDVSDEAEKHHVKEKGGKAWENGKDGFKNWNGRRRSRKS